MKKGKSILIQDPGGTTEVWVDRIYFSGGHENVRYKRTLKDGSVLIDLLGVMLLMDAAESKYKKKVVNFGPGKLLTDCIPPPDDFHVNGPNLRVPMWDEHLFCMWLAETKTFNEEYKIRGE